MRKFLVGCGIVGWIVSMAEGAVPGRMIQMNFRESPIEHVADFYQDLKQVPVTLAAGTYATITLETLRVTDAEAIDLIEGVFTSNGVQVVVSGDGVMLSPDPAWRPSGTGSVSVVEADKAFVDSAEKKSANSSNMMTEEALKAHLLEYHMEVKRQGLPSMPLTEFERSVGITEDDLK